MPGREPIQRAIRYSGVKNPFRPCPSPWPKVLGAAAVGGAATLFLARNFFPSEKKIHHDGLCGRRRRLRSDNGKSAGAALAERQQGNRPRKWRSDFSRVA